MTARRTLVALVTLAALAVPASPLAAQIFREPVFTHADSVRGTWGPTRDWWDVTFYDLHVRVSPADSSIAGWNGITYRVTKPGREMQIDLQLPMQLDSMVMEGRKLQARRDGSAFFVTLPSQQRTGESHTVTVYYHGKPRVAVRPPWDGGFQWTRDDVGQPWISTSNQGLGASVWWPTKDHPTEEPDSQRVAITVPTPMVDVSNGRLRSSTVNADGTTTWEWFSNEPINNYGISVNAGEYAHWQQIYQGENGPLTMDFWPLAVHEDLARSHWTQAVTMMRCFEHWFGPYPFYEDGYKLVEAPYLGMEHQTAVTYGNRFGNGYLGTDLSGTGLGLQWDYIIVHESAHEWFANNITAADDADMWLHEGFAMYAEGLFTECLTGSKESGATYIRGVRAGISNDRPIQGIYGVNFPGSSDMYNKGANVLHTIRQIVNDDEKWRQVLRGLNREFHFETVTSAQVEGYITRESGKDLALVWDQYVRTTMIPRLEYRLEGRRLFYRWANVVDGFHMPVRATLGPDRMDWLRPTQEWQSVDTDLTSAADFRVDPNFYVTTRGTAR